MLLIFAQKSNSMKWPAGTSHPPTRRVRGRPSPPTRTPGRMPQVQDRQSCTNAV